MPLVSRLELRLSTRDLAATRRFWCAGLGLREQGLLGDEPGPADGCILLGEAVALTFYVHDDPPALTGVITLSAHGLDDALDAAGEAPSVVWGPEVDEQGTREVGLRDPNGYVVALIEAAGDAPDA